MTVVDTVVSAAAGISDDGEKEHDAPGGRPPQLRVTGTVIGPNKFSGSANDALPPLGIVSDDTEGVPNPKSITLSLSARVLVSNSGAGPCACKLSE